MTKEQEKAIRIIKTARGQLDGIIKMIEEGRYCIDISNQLLASISLLKGANVSILNGHLKHCIKNEKNDDKLDDKIDEVVNVLRKLS